MLKELICSWFRLSWYQILFEIEYNYGFIRKAVWIEFIAATVIVVAMLTPFAFAAKLWYTITRNYRKVKDFNDAVEELLDEIYAETVWVKSYL